MPEGDEAFHIETHGVDEIALRERWASPRDVGWLWAGANVEMETLMCSAIAGMNGAIAGRYLDPAPQSCVAGRHGRAVGHGHVDPPAPADETSDVAPRRWSRDATRASSPTTLHQFRNDISAVLLAA